MHCESAQGKRDRGMSRRRHSQKDGVAIVSVTVKDTEPCYLQNNAAR